MGNQPENFFDLSYIPEGFILQDPCRMKRPVADLLDHLRQRQSDNTVVTFAFKNVLSNGKFVPASYSEVAILAMSKKKLRDGSPPPDSHPTVKPEHLAESDSPSHRPTRPLPPRIPCGAGEHQILASPGPAQSSNTPGTPCSDIYVPNDPIEDTISRAPSEAPVPQASGRNTPAPGAASQLPTPEAEVLAPVQAHLVQAAAADSDATVPPNVTGSIVPPPNGHLFIFPNSQSHGYPTQQSGLNSNTLPPAPPQSWEVYTPPGMMEASGSAPIQPGFGSGSTPQFYYIPNTQGWVQQPLQSAPYPTMQPAPYPAMQPAPYPTMQPAPYPTMQPAPYPNMQPGPYPNMQAGYTITPNAGPLVPTAPIYPSVNSQFDNSLDPLLQTAGTSMMNAISTDPKVAPKPRMKPRVDAPSTKYQDDSNFIHHRAQAHPFSSKIAAGTPALVSPPIKRKRQLSIGDEQPMGKRRHVPRRTDEHFPAATEEDFRTTAKLPRQRKGHS